MECSNDIKRLYNASKDILSGITYRNDDPIQYFCILLYLTIIENIYSCIFLIDEKLNSSIGIILRSMLEAYIDLNNLSNDKAYLNVLKVSDISIKILKSSIKHNIFRDTYERLLIKEYLDCKDLKGVLEKMIEVQKYSYDTAVKHYDLDRNNRNEISIYQKFKIANKVLWYDEQYAMLCSFSHNNLNALIHRHVPYNETGDNSIQMFPSIDQIDLDYYFYLISFILFDSVDFISNILNINDDKLIEINELREKFKKYDL